MWLTLGGKLLQGILQSQADHASKPCKRHLGHFPVLGRGGVHLSWPGWQVHLSQAFPPGLCSIAGVQGAGCKPFLVLKYPPLCPPSLPSCRAPAMGVTWLPPPKSSARSLVAVRRHPGWHPGLTPDALPPSAGKTLSSGPHPRASPRVAASPAAGDSPMHRATPQATTKPRGARHSHQPHYTHT